MEKCPCSPTRVFTPQGGEPMDVRVTIADRMDDEASARATLKEFKVVLDPKEYFLDLDDGVKVIIKKRSAGKPFALAIAEQSVTGLSIEIR